MRRVIALAMSILTALSLAACGGASSETAATTKAAEAAGSTATADKKEYTIVYLTPSTASQFWTYVEIGIKNAMMDLEDKYGIKINYSTVGPAEESQTEDYVTAFEQTIAKKPDAIVTATLAIDATIPKAQEATKNGIVLNFVNCGIGVGDDGANQDAYNEFYFCSNDTIGEMAAQAFLDACARKKVDTSKGTVGINTNVENEALNHRVDGFRSYLKEKAPGLVQTDTYYNGNNVEKAQTNAENILSTFGKDLIGMYSGNNITGDGVCNAVQAAGMGSRLVNVAVDSDDTEIAALKSGNCDAIIVQDAYKQGYLCMENAIETLVQGKNPEEKKQINCPPVVITPDNMNSTEMQDLLDPTRLAKSK